jgi:hypothetical protein
MKVPIESSTNGAAQSQAVFAEKRGLNRMKSL